MIFDIVPSYVETLYDTAAPMEAWFIDEAIYARFMQLSVESRGSTLITFNINIHLVPGRSDFED